MVSAPMRPPYIYGPVAVPRDFVAPVLDLRPARDSEPTLNAAAAIYALGAVTIDGAEIRTVEPQPERPAGKIIDLRGSVLIPGLVNVESPQET
jgi:imidazolonepropionase-like amidohydrolase